MTWKKELEKLLLRREKYLAQARNDEKLNEKIRTLQKNIKWKKKKNITE